MKKHNQYSINTTVQNGDYKENRRGKKSQTPTDRKHDIGTNGSTLGAEEEGTPQPHHRSFLQRHAFMITLMLTTMMDTLGFAVRGQYRYRFFHSKYEDELSLYNTTSGCGVKAPPEVEEIENKITGETAQWSLYEMYTGIVPMMTAALVVGLRSDQIGRRFIFLFPFFTSFLDCVCLAVITRFKLHYAYTLIGFFIYSVSGGNVSMAFAAYALVSDTHGKKKTIESEEGQGNAVDGDGKKKEVEAVAEEDDNDLDPAREKLRTFKIVVVDVLRRMSSSLVSFATGYIIQYAGFFYTMILVIGLRICVFLFAFTFVTETGEQKKSAGFLGPLRTIWGTTKNKRKRVTLLLVTLGLLLSVFSLVDEIEVLRTYQMSPPFCFDAVQLGWFNSENRIKGVLAIPLMLVFRRIGLSESTVAAVGLISGGGAALLLAIVRQTWVFWAIPVISIPSDLTLSMAKSITSRLIGRSALASTFALVLVAEEVFWFAGSNATNYLYKFSLDTVPTAPFYLAAASFFLSSTLFIAQSIYQRKYPEVMGTSTDTEKEMPAENTKPKPM